MRRPVEEMSVHELDHERDTLQDMIELGAFRVLRACCSARGGDDAWASDELKTARSDHMPGLLEDMQRLELVLRERGRR